MKTPDLMFPVNPEGLEDTMAELLKPVEENEEHKKPTPANIESPESYIILPGKSHGSYSYPDLLVPIQKDYFGSNWNQMQEALHKGDEIMLTIRQFADFLDLLKNGKAYDGKGKKLPSAKSNEILKEITEVRSPWRGENLDVKFSTSGLLTKTFNITYHKINSDGTLKEVTENLQDCLMQDKAPGIDFSYWLKNATSQGLPTANTPQGDLYYWKPVDGAVAWFWALSDWAGLGCGRNPGLTDASLGVRRARKK